MDSPKHQASKTTVAEKINSWICRTASSYPSIYTQTIGVPRAVLWFSLDFFFSFFLQFFCFIALPAFLALGFILLLCLLSVSI